MSMILMMVGGPRDGQVLILSIKKIPPEIRLALTDPFERLTSHEYPAYVYVHVGQKEIDNKLVQVYRFDGRQDTEAQLT